jgi:hypothetical protein
VVLYIYKYFVVLGYVGVGVEGTLVTIGGGAYTGEGRGRRVQG